MTDETRREVGRLPVPHETQRDDRLPPETIREGAPMRPAPTRREDPGGGEWRIPRVITSRFSVKRPFDASGNEADAFLVSDDRGNLLFAKVYRRGIRPNAAVLEQLNNAATTHVIQYLEAGYSEADGCYYELLEYVERGTLADLLAAEGPQLGFDLVRAVLEELNGALQHVHDRGIEHRDLKPANVLVRSREPLDLVLTDFGISSAMDSTHRFTSMNRTVLYSPPEALTGAVHRTRWDYWSLGIILVELLTGRHPFAGQNELVASTRLITSPTDELVEGLDDPHWRKLCRGLLRRDPTARWDGSAVERWLQDPDDPSLVVREEVAAHADQAPVFRFLGKAYRTPDQLGGALADNWSEGLRLWRTEQPALFRWLRDDLGELAIVGLLEKERERSKSDTRAHAQLFSVIHILAPNRVPSFLGRPVLTTEIRRAAAGAAGGAESDAEWLIELHRSNVILISAQLPQADRDLQEIGAAWNSAVAEYQQEGAKARSASGNKVVIPELSGPTLAALLAAATAGSPALEAVRKRAAASATDLARRRLWFEALGDPRKASAASAVLMQLLGKAAEKEVAADRRERVARNSALWGSMLTGSMLGGVAVGVWWLAVAEYCTGGAPMCFNAGWPRRELEGLEVLALAAASAVAVGVLIRVHLLTTRGGHRG